jgi:hypothetical protein
MSGIFHLKRSGTQYMFNLKSSGNGEVESPRFLRRLNTLRGWSHEEDEQVLA